MNGITVRIGLQKKIDYLLIRIVDNEMMYVLAAGTEVVKTRFDIDAFQTTLKSLLPQESSVITMPIIIENYCGLGALVHNRNSLGFFKIRGKVSF